MTIKVLWGTLFLFLVLGAVALSMWGIPAPKHEVVKVLKTDKLVRR